MGSTVSINTADGGGFGFSGAGSISSSGRLTVANLTVSGNVKNSGNSNAGGISAHATTTITSSTITDNDAAGASSAGGIKRVIGAMVRDTIVAANRNNTTLPDVSGAFTSEGYNLIGNRGTATGFTAIGDQAGGNGNPIVNPPLFPLGNNGGTTPTHALIDPSPAVDKSGSFGSSTDQRGFFWRPFDVMTISNLADGSDIGAFELQGAVEVVEVASVKTHGSAGTFSIALPLTGTAGVECRSGGATNAHTVVFTFANTLTSVTGASVTSGTATVTAPGSGPMRINTASTSAEWRMRKRSFAASRM